MSSVRKFFIPICSLLAFGIVAKADYPNTLFEIDGDSITGNTCTSTDKTALGCDDWNLLNGDGTTANSGAPGHSLTRTFASEPAGVNVFQGGGSKDPLPLLSWRWKQGSTPDKDTITNAYAAAYKDNEGDLNLMFGADRFAVNGSANIGLWFFQDNVYPVGTGSGGFHGAHTNNDLFVVSAFSQGGGYSTITVYQWDDTCTRAVKNPTKGQCADTNLKFLYSSPGNVTCGYAGCAFVNTGEITVQWAYLAKFGSSSKLIPAGGFFEGGLDVGTLLPGTTLPCFTSFLIETRSSQETSAVLKDFISGSFKVCGITVTKNCGTNANAPYLNAGGTSVHYHYDGTVQNVGIGTLYNVTLIDNELPVAATNITFAPSNRIFSSLNAGNAPTAWTLDFDLTAPSVQNRASAMGAIAANANPTACGDVGTVCSPVTEWATCSFTAPTTITVTKACGIPKGYPGAPLASIPGTTLENGTGEVAVRVNFSGEVCNTGQIPLSGFSLTDSPSATITTLPATLNAGECTQYSGTYKPTTFAGDGVTAGRYNFTDNIKVTGATGTLGSPPAPASGCTDSDAQACAVKTCNICPGNPSGLCGGD